MEGKTKANVAKVKENKDRTNKMVIVKSLIEKGKKSGILTYKEIMDEIDHIDLEPEQIEKIYEVLESMGIEVQGDMNEVSGVEEEELDLDNVTCIKVQNTRAALASMSASFFNQT